MQMTKRKKKNHTYMHTQAQKEVRHDDGSGRAHVFQRQTYEFVVQKKKKAKGIVQMCDDDEYSLV